MASKQTYSKSIVWQPGVEGNTAKQLVTSGRELTVLALKSGAGAAVVSFYDSNVATTNYADLKWVLDCSTTDTDSQVFPNPLFFKKGVYAVLDQGVGSNPIVCLGYIPDQV